MSDEDQNKGDTGAGTEDQGVEEVKIPAGTYNALLDRLNELEEAVTKAATGGKKGNEIDELADEGRGRRAPQAPPAEAAVDLENVTNRDLVNMILGHVEQNMMQPILVGLEKLRIQGEIKDLNAPDFDEYKDAIYKIASKNPTLSIKQAYKLAKEEAPAKGGDKSETPSRRDVLTNLPPRRPTPSEKPGTSQSATRKGDPSTIKDAAMMALEDMKKAGRTI